MNLLRLINQLCSSAFKMSLTATFTVSLLFFFREGLVHNYSLFAFPSLSSLDFLSLEAFSDLVDSKLW